MNIPYPANIYVREALASAVIKLEGTIKDCGALVHSEAKISPEAKLYFERRGAEAETIIIELKKQMAQI